MWAPIIKQWLGRYPDPVIAEVMGISKSSVIKARRRMGIPSYVSGDLISRSMKDRDELMEEARAALAGESAPVGGAYREDLEL